MSHRLTILIHGHILKSAASEERSGGSCSLSFNCPSNSPWPVPELSQCSSEKTHLGNSSPLCLNLVELQHQFFSICALSFRLHNSAEASSVCFSLFIFLISLIVIFVLLVVCLELSLSLFWNGSLQSSPGWPPALSFLLSPSMSF